MKRNGISLLVVLLTLLCAGAGFGQQDAKTETTPFKPVLLVVDIQNAYLPMMDQKDVQPGMENINALIELFRKNNYPVIRVYHTDIQQGPKPGSEGFEFPKTVVIRDDDPKVIKNYPSAFVKTNLDQILKEKGCTTVYVSGLSAVGCALATYFGAMERQYEAYLVSDAIISHNAELTNCVRRITPSPNVKAVSLQLKVLSGDVKALENLTAETLGKDYGIDSPAKLNAIGYFLVMKHRLADAIIIFKTNARLFPEEANCYDSLGEAYEHNGQKDMALASYEKACQKAKEKNDTQLKAYEQNYNRLKGASK